MLNLYLKRGIIEDLISRRDSMLLMTHYLHDWCWLLTSGSIPFCSVVLPQESSRAECHTDGMKTSKSIRLKRLHFNIYYKSCTYVATIVINLALCWVLIFFSLIKIYLIYGGMMQNINCLSTATFTSRLLFLSFPV